MGKKVDGDGKLDMLNNINQQKSKVGLLNGQCIVVSLL